MMKIQTGVKVVAVVDAVWSIILIVSVIYSIEDVMKNKDGPVGLENECAFVLDLFLFALLCSAQSWTALMLYNAANANSCKNSGIWAWFLVTALVIGIVFCGLITELREVMLEDAALSLLLTFYKILAVFVVIKFKRNLIVQDPIVVYVSPSNILEKVGPGPVEGNQVV